jgi:hypothetical protein
MVWCAQRAFPPKIIGISSERHLRKEIGGAHHV